MTKRKHKHISDDDFLCPVCGMLISKTEISNHVFKHTRENDDDMQQTTTEYLNDR
jgi:hypothetical protein